MNQDLMAQQAEIYKMPGVDESVPAVNPAKKRKEAELEDVSRCHATFSCSLLSDT